MNKSSPDSLKKHHDFAATPKRPTLLAAVNAIDL